MLAQAVARTLDLDDDGVMKEAIEECGGDDGIAEDLAPFGEAAVGGENHSAALVARVDELEEEVGTAGTKGQVPDLVDDEKRVAGNEADALPELAFALGLEQRGDDISEGAEVDALAGLDGLDTKGDCQMGLAGAGWPEEVDDLLRTMKSSSANARMRLRSSDGWKVKSNPDRVLMAVSRAVISAILNDGSHG